MLMYSILSRSSGELQTVIESEACELGERILERGLGNACDEDAKPRATATEV